MAAVDSVPSSAGTISFIQRFGDGLRSNPHIHLLVSEGAWVESKSKPGNLEFLPSQAPSPDEVCALLEWIQSRIVKHLTRLGLIKEGPSQAETSGVLELKLGEKNQSPEEQLLSEMQGCSTQNRFALSAPPGKLVRRERQTELGEFGRVGDRARLASDENRLAILKGFSLHAGTFAPAKQEGDPPNPSGQSGLERLLRYMARNSTPLERMGAASNGDVLIKLKTRWSDGTTHLRFSGVELCERLAALVPHPRLNLIRFGGVFAPRHKLRAQVVALAPKAESVLDGSATSSCCVTSNRDESSISPKPKKYSISWRELRARVFQEDLTRCRRCGDTVKVTDAVLDRGAISRILLSHGRPTQIPKFAPPSRGPPDSDFQQDDFSWA